MNLMVALKIWSISGFESRNGLPRRVVWSGVWSHGITAFTASIIIERCAENFLQCSRKCETVSSPRPQAH